MPIVIICDFPNRMNLISNDKARRFYDSKDHKLTMCINIRKKSVVDTTENSPQL